MAHMFPGTGWLPDTFDEQDLQYVPRSDLVAKGSRNLRTDNDTKDFWESRTDKQKENEKAWAAKNSSTYQEFEPLVLNQYTLSSCVANATTAAYAYELRRANALQKDQKNSNWFLPSRTFIYYNARQALNEPVMTDSGCLNRNAMKSLHKLGVISEEALPYPFDPQEVDHIRDAKETDIRNSCRAHLEKLSADDVFGVFMSTFEEAVKLKKPFNEARVKQAKELKDKNEMEKLKLKNLCIEYIVSLPAGSPGSLLNRAWVKILRKSAQANSALYPGIHRYLAAKYFRIAKYERLDAKRTEKQQQEWVEKRNMDAMDKDGKDLKENLKKALTDGHPVVFGFRFYADTAGMFSDTKNDKCRVMNLDEKKRHQWPAVDEGGHAVVAVGYDDKNVIALNSWGKSWGNAGTFLMPWEWITDFAATSDFWVLESFRDISNVDNEDIKDMKKDLFEFSKALVEKQKDLKSAQDALVDAKQKLAKHDSTTNTNTKYDAVVVGQALTMDAIEKMKPEEVQKALYTAQKSLFEVEKQLRTLTEELAAVKQKLEKFEPKKP